MKIWLVILVLISTGLYNGSSAQVDTLISLSPAEVYVFQMENIHVDKITACPCYIDLPTQLCVSFTAQYALVFNNANDSARFDNVSFITRLNNIMGLDLTCVYFFGCYKIQNSNMLVANPPLLKIDENYPQNVSFRRSPMYLEPISDSCFSLVRQGTRKSKQ